MTKPPSNRHIAPTIENHDRQLVTKHRYKRHEKHLLQAGELSSSLAGCSQFNFLVRLLRHDKTALPCCRCGGLTLRAQGHFLVRLLRRDKTAFRGLPYFRCRELTARVQAVQIRGWRPPNRADKPSGCRWPHALEETDGGSSPQKRLDSKQDEGPAQREARGIDDLEIERGLMTWKS